MTNAIDASHTDQLSITEYYVVPVEARATRETIEVCRFYTTRWEHRKADELDVEPGRAACVALQQVPPAKLPRAVQEELAQDGLRADPVAGLFAAVAKTLKQEGGALPNNFLATGEAQAARLLLPVMSGSTRGVILVFKKPAVGPTETLVASADPEIKNGTNGMR